ncbi:hypothetical protein BS50DRAFT_15739 [Corynespora cassiicola Philippines]|uniref:Lytic polysaccharide monooxygenase n=1 Tax=Corynespora cassiicola Philippines TaxID=1448308 RepID=A0A2T2P9U2_CORCC|nr:hypothetical protein BS50DRAFT_15739 [Corynespora cassiicola Philippines]
MLFSQTSSLLALAAGASAHMILREPVPYGQATLNSSPLEAGDFPCKQRSGAYEVTEMNQWAAGDNKTIKFTGSAVHGGGSCQFSITTDMQPTKESQWKVIHSVIGGCPADAPGNLTPEDPNGHGAGEFPVMMPANIPAGQYSFAWTWINKIGNREFYMNCAPIEVTGSEGGDVSTLSALPDMFVANLPSTSCSTAEEQDFEFPNPGDSVVTGANAAVGNTLTGAGCDVMTKMGAGSGSMGAPSGGSGSSSGSGSGESGSGYGSGSASGSPVAPEVPQNTGGSLAPVDPKPADPVSSAAPSSAPSPAPEAPAAAPSAAPSAPSTPSTGSGNSSGGEAGVSCQNDGEVVCIGSNQWGMCNHGTAVPMALAAGTTCTNGKVSRRSVYAPRAHLHRRHNKHF